MPVWRKPKDASDLHPSFQVLSYHTSCHILLLRSLRSAHAVIPAVSASAAINDSQTPRIPNIRDNITEHTAIATNPLQTEAVNASFACSDALRYPVPIILKPANKIRSHKAAFL